MTNRLPVIHTLALSLATLPPTLYHRYKLLLFTAKRKWYSSFLKYYTLSILERQGGEGRNEKPSHLFGRTRLFHADIQEWINDESLWSLTKDSRTIHKKKEKLKKSFHASLALDKNSLAMYANNQNNPNWLFLLTESENNSAAAARLITSMFRGCVGSSLLWCPFSRCPSVFCCSCPGLAVIPFYRYLLCKKWSLLKKEPLQQLASILS